MKYLYNVKKYSTQYSVSKSKQRKAEEWQLNRELQEASQVFKTIPVRNIIKWNKCIIKRLRVQKFDDKQGGMNMHS